jgi:hypothetical protein|tara:strand:- start:98 stop:892 length:795 start_codon:yes stop_codon:yes gene_type:complete
MKKTRVIQIIREEIEKIVSRDDINEAPTVYNMPAGGDEEAFKGAMAGAKEKQKEGTAMYKILDTLEDKMKVNFNDWAEETGKDKATWNNPKSREILMKDLGDFLEWDQGKRGRKADPNKPAKVKKDKATTKAEKSDKANDESDVEFSVLDKTVTSTKDSSEKDIEKKKKKVSKSVNKTKKLNKNTPQKNKEEFKKVEDEMKELGGEYKQARLKMDDVEMDRLKGKLIKLRDQRDELIEKNKKYIRDEEDRVSNIGKDDKLQATD